MNNSIIRVDAEQTAYAFTQAYHYSPVGVWSAPGRVNMIGEHVDYAGGICLPFAINRRTFCAAALRHDGVIRCASLFPGTSEPSLWEGTLDSISTSRPKNWAAYPAGVMWCMAQAADILGLTLDTTTGFDCFFLSDVPIGAGLSSSAALEVATACAVMDLIGSGLKVLSRDPLDDISRTIIDSCIRAENEVVGAATGGLDQYASFCGVEGMAIKLDMGENTIEKIPFDLKANGLALLVMNTNVPHHLEDGQYESRRDIVDRVMRGLDISAPHREHHVVRRAVEWATTQPEASYDEDSREEWQELVSRRMRHIVTESRRAENLAKALKAGVLGDPHDSHTQRGLEKVGGIMLSSHESLRDDYEVSCVELDSAVDAAMEAGAWGARMTGGGFGGSAIALIKKKEAKKVQRSVSEAARRAQLNTPTFLVAIPSSGAGRDC